MIAPRRTRIKFCGMTSVEDVALAVQAGADAVGVIVAPSARNVPLDRVAEIATAIPPLVSRVAVLVDQSQREADALRALGFTLQFSGNETPAECLARSGGQPYIKVFHIEPRSKGFDIRQCAAYTAGTWMFDTRIAGMAGGSGMTFDWDVIESAARIHPTIVSGGLTAENVAGCVRSVRPFGVDVRSGIETAARKDAAKMTAFAAAVGVGES